MATPRDVLILDDDAMITRMFVRLLKGRHTVRTAHTIDEALPLLEERRPDVLLCDFELGQGDTRAFLRLVKARWPGVRCVLHSASRMELWRDLLVDQIVDRVLVKPAPVGEILAAMNGA